MPHLLKKSLMAVCVSAPILFHSIPPCEAHILSPSAVYAVDSKISIIDWSSIIQKHISRGLSYEEAIELCCRLAQLYGPVLRPEASEAGYTALTIYFDRSANVGISFPC